MAALKKFWHTISTGWVVEYPGRSGDGPRDFFDRRSDGPRQSQRLSPYSEQDQDCAPRREEEQRARKEEEEREDAIARWSEQIRTRSSRDSRSQAAVEKKIP